MKSHYLSAETVFRLALIFTPALLQAGSPAPESVKSQAPADENWWFHSTTYAWITAVSGDMRIGRLSAPMDVSFGDAINSLDELDMGFMGGLEVGRGRWSLGVDATYMKASDDIAGGGVIFRSFHVEQSQWMINPFASYQLVKGDGWQLDAIVGARINIIEMDLTGRLAGGGELTVGGSREWADPIIGLRGKLDLSDIFSIGFRGEIGGFGVSSDFAWQAYVGLGWQLTPRSTLALGYRGLGTDYSQGDFGSDTVTHGPLIGLQIKF